MFRSGDLPLVEPASPSMGYANAKRMIAERARSSSILELMELVPAIFREVKAVELLNESSRAGYSRRVHGFVQDGTISGIHQVPEDEDDARLKHTLETSLLIRPKPGLVSNMTLFSEAHPMLRGGLASPSEAADIEEQAIFHQLSVLFGTVLGSRIGRLTLLPNKDMLEAAAAAAENDLRKDGREFCLLVADIDRLKTINQNHSSAAGDMVLAAVADRLRNLLAACGYKGSVIFRPGKNKFLDGVRKDAEAVSNPGLKHDEFVLILPKTLKEAAEMADLLRQEIAKLPVELQLPHSGGVMVTCSFAVAHSSNPTDKGGSLWHGMLDACVRLLETAKSRGGDTVVF